MKTQCELITSTYQYNNKIILALPSITVLQSTEIIQINSSIPKLALIAYPKPAHTCKLHF
jgi:hypothetical protein